MKKKSFKLSKEEANIIHDLLVKLVQGGYTEFLDERISILLDKLSSSELIDSEVFTISSTNKNIFYAPYNGSIN